MHISIAGLVLDILGAGFLAVDFFHPFRGQTIKDVGSGAINGGAHLVVNPDAIAHANKNRVFILIGLSLLFLGFVLQGIGTWLSSLHP